MQHDFGKQCYSNHHEESNEHEEVPKRTIRSGAIRGVTIQNIEYLSVKITVS